ncbi:hypothetical protein GCM10022204_23220 [Microlunatus aurantiacus]|uniref:HTH luxR-type domain-containing protein n=1 Tax=Microlunatus aurantiacus TaxID=446786 RepID=A0ABP7DFY6_9ACTN
MSTTAARSMQWVGFVGDLLRQPLTRMPHEEIVHLLRQTFDLTAASYSWAEADGSQGILIHPYDTLAPIADDFLAWQRGEYVGRHPLLTWHQTVGDPRPSTNERVPHSVVSARERRPLLDQQKTIGCEQQLAINYRLGSRVYHSFVLARSGTDFSDEDLAVAGQIQRVVIGLDRHIVWYRQLTGSAPGREVEAGLTPRELTVLALVAEGLTTTLIARRLGCSPRTVEKHVERSYRKLGVRDRVNAVRVAREWDLLGPPTRSTGKPRTADSASGPQNPPTAPPPRPEPGVWSIGSSPCRSCLPPEPGYR